MPGVEIFHAGTRREGERHPRRRRARARASRRIGQNVAEAQARAYEAIDRIDWPEGFCRRDIGWRAIGRPTDTAEIKPAITRFCSNFALLRRDRPVQIPLAEGKAVMSVESRIGLALGGGGARGMAHILVCEVFDELGIKPAADRRHLDRRDHRRRLRSRLLRPRDARGDLAFYGKRREVLARLWKARPLAFTDLLRGRSLTPQFDARVILDSFVPGFERLPETFEELAIPLKIIACDFYAWTEAVLCARAA